jgi:hypothetical protein
MRLQKELFVICYKNKIRINKGGKQNEKKDHCRNPL